MDVVYRAAIVYVLLWVLLRAMGRRELAELTPFDLVVLIVLGDLVQQGVTQEDMSITGAMLAAGTMALLTIVLSVFSYKSQRARRIFKGAPVMVIHDGEPLKHAMRLQRLDMESLCDAARQQGISDLAMVQCAVLEADGMFSFIKKQRGDGDGDSGDAGGKPAESKTR
ncbi:MAG TPA: YetF domain-containing protein [Solirubrobacterales bacterium]|jgi:uncharacterized membrane protein YcaP (DUF421 family)|nr:YetF domain-containing protein [Solirubrobacterales bacterium]